MTEATQFLRADSLCAGYRKTIIADGISFTAESGRILTLIGPNGAGKSTVLRTISAQLPPLGGTVAVCGKALESYRENELAKTISVMLTERLSAERMTCGDVAETGRYPYTGALGLLTDADRSAVRAAMQMVGTANLYDRDFRQISDGQRQSVMLARAIAQEPKVLLLDEPTSFLDISHKLHILSLLRRLARERGIAVIMSLHELDLAQKFSDSILCIRNGKADRFGTPEEIFSGDYIASLYGIETGSYDVRFGTAEPSAPDAPPAVFVIGGGGSGIPVYRRLHRAGIPFAAGVLHENDLELPTANALASQVITSPAFEPIGEPALAEARTVIESCEKVICCTAYFGTVNRANETLFRAAEADGKCISADEI